MPRVLPCIAAALWLTMLGPLPVAAASFPLHVSTDGRHLVDAHGDPFLLVGDAAWSLIGDLSREDVDRYLDDRQRRGFNTILVSLIENVFSRDHPRNFYGASPFPPGGNFASINDAYFDYAEWVLRRAREKGFVVLLTPAYLGGRQGAEGWYREMAAAGPDALEAYGEYVGRRFGGLGNIVWIEGGDYDPPDKALVQALVKGIGRSAPHNLQSFHGNPGSAGRLFWGDPQWLDIDALYSYDDIQAAGRDRYDRQPPKPFFLIETRYEGEGASEFDIRRGAYEALLSGAFGYVFGNNPIWHFSGPGLYPSALSWQETLGSRGAESMTHLHALFDRIQWWRLRPDDDAHLVAVPRGGVVAAHSADGGLVLAYLWDAQSVTVTLQKAQSSLISAQWFDPSSGTFYKADARLYGDGAASFDTPSQKNAAGFTDWVLVVSR